MLRKIFKSLFPAVTGVRRISFCLPVISIFVLLLCMSCDEIGRVMQRSPNVYDTVVCFRVNWEGDGFINIGRGNDKYDADEFTAVSTGGEYTASGGRRVFNTAGRTDGQWIIPWWTSGRWDRYVDVGWVDFCEKTGELIASSEEWAVEVVFAFPVSHPSDMADQWLWAFSDSSVPTNGGVPNTYIGFNWREITVFAVDVPNSTGGRSGFNTTDDWVAGIPYRDMASGWWVHLVTTKDKDGIISNYINGILINRNPTQFRPSDTSPYETIPYPDYEDGSVFTVRTFGKTLYADWRVNPNGSGAAYGNDISRAGLYHFAIDDKAWNDAEAKRRYEKSFVGQGILSTW